MQVKTKRKAAASSHKYRGKKSYGVGGAVMTLGKNLLQGKKLGSGAFKGVLRAGITPGSGIGAGIGLAGALAGKSKNPTMQKIGKGLGIAGNVAGLFTGGGGAGALGGLAGKVAGSGVGQAASKFAGKFAGVDKALHGLGAGGGNPLFNLVKNFIPGMSGANGMRVRRFDDGGKPKLGVKELLEALEVDNPELMNKAVEFVKSDDRRALNQLLNQQYRIDMKRLEQEGNEELEAERDKRRDERKRLNQEYFEEIESDDAGEEVLEGEGGIDKERMMKLLKSGGLGLGAISIAKLIPLIYKLLKKKKDSIHNPGQYHNVFDPMPGPRDPFWRQPNQSARGRNQ
jgi:hypothetical protein